MAAPLSSLRVLVVDCQSTGATPERGHLLEVAWAVASASAGLGGDDVRSSLVRLPAGAEIPPRVAALTGITGERLAAARDPASVWAELTADADDADDRWAVVHCARFEERFLKDLHARFGAGPFPLRLACTREIARRVMPELPRFGLRALAGHLGHALPEKRRAADHVRATVCIWQELCRLAAERGVRDAEGLAELLESPPPGRGEVERRFPLPAEKRAALPDRHGVYRFVDPGGRVLYVGKAASLRQRVATYFQPRGYRLDTTLEMLTQAFDVQYEVTATRLEAALLEVDEIKRLDPPYNTALRDRDNRRPSAAEMFQALLFAIHSPQSFLESETATPLTGLAYPDPPEVETLQAGVDLFREVFLHGRKATRSLLAALGSVLWWEVKPDPRRDGVHPRPETSAEEQDASRTFEWTPTRVARSLARAARHAAHLQRREIWQRLIRSGTVTWRRREGDAGDRVLSIEDGAVADRLRVLTTEIRRLAADDRLIEVRLANDVGLTPERVRGLLEWV